MNIRVVWYDFAGNERHCKYRRIVDVRMDDNGSLWLFNEDIPDDMGIKGALAVYAPGEWHHIEKTEIVGDVDVPDVYRDAE